MEWYYRFLNFLHRPLVQPGEKDPFHHVFPEFQNLLKDLQTPVVLEIGSRNVTGITRRHLFPSVERYIGFDVHPGEGVDVVGDAHQLANYFEPNSVDAIFAVSVFEHLAFPWKVAMEINRVLKPGGYVFVSTHPTWPAHELPWDFWRYPVAGLANLFIHDTGFEVLRATEGLPCKAYSLVTDAPTRPFYKFSLNMGVAVLAKKTHDYDSNRLKWDIDIHAAVRTQYPKPGA